MIRIGTDCSGIETPIIAFKRLNIPFIHEFSSDIDPTCQQIIKSQFKPKLFFNDMTTRDHSKLPKLDLYICGFPCQSYSTIGFRKGLNDPRGQIIFQVFQTIKFTKPETFILENVRGLLSSDNGNTFKMIIETLESLEYNVQYHILNSKDFGIPQNRIRVYIIGTKKQIPKLIFSKTRLTPIETFLEQNPTDPKTLCKSHRIKYDNWITNELKDKLIFVSLNYPNVSYSTDYIHCLTSRCATYIPKLNRILSPLESVRLQGIKDDELNLQKLSDSKICKLSGNCMTVDVLQEIFIRINI